MSYEKIFDESYERVIRVNRGEKDFFGAFYDNFLASSDEIRAKFVNTDMSVQQRMLKKSFYSLVVFYAGNAVDPHLERIAESHNKKNLNIRPELYDIWLDCLIITVKDWDPEYSEEVELAWRLVMSIGITYMKFKYSHS